MMDVKVPTLNAISPGAGPANNTQNSDKKALFMREQNDRLGGSVPEWRATNSAREETVFRLSMADEPGAQEGSQFVQSFQGYRMQSVPSDKAYGFDDMIDMINPLHHIPIVGGIYRGVTGDQINPAGRVIGGTIYGGSLGAASSIANIISEEETGKDIPELVMDGLDQDRDQNAYIEQQYEAYKKQADVREPITGFTRPQYNE